MNGLGRRVWRGARVVAALSLCFGAMGATVYAESTSLETVLALGSDPEPEPEPVPDSAEPATAPASATAPEPAPIPDGIAPPAGVLVPNLQGATLSQAFERADAAGLRLRATDAFGDPVPRRWARDYRVRRQLTAPGELVDDGSVIRLKVRSFGAAMGY